jgi:hypothetical protein
MSEEQKTRKELIAEYKETKQPMGVYQIRNISNGKLYVSSSLNLRAAWNGEKFRLDMGGHLNLALQADYKIFGPDAFVFEILHELKLADEVKDVRGELKALETLTIDELQPFGERGYNRPPKR